MPVVVTIHHWTRGNRIVRFKYDERLKDAIKSVPGSWYEPAERAWIIPDYQEGVVIQLCQDYGATVTVERPNAARSKRAQEAYGDAPPPPRTEAPTPPAQWAIALFAAMPPPLCESVYKALAKVLHPDKGGDLRMCQDLTDAYQHRRT